MKRFLRDNGVPVALFIIKLLTTLRTGIDTYSVTNDILDVALIDGVFLAFWLVAAYTGTGKQAMAIRPFAAAGAWILYAAQLYIGWEATHMAVAFVVRVAGGLALLYDTYDYMATVFSRRQRATSVRERRAKQRLAVMNVGYLLFVVIGTPVWWLGSGVSVFLDFLRDAGLVIQQASHVTAVNELDVVDGQVTDIVSTNVMTLSKDDRQAKIVDIYDGQDDRTLADIFGVSPRTIKRDKQDLNLD